MGFLAVSVAGPLTSASSYASPQAEGAAAPDMGPAQVYTAEGDIENVVDRDEYGVTKPKPKPKPVAAAAIGAPAAGTPDPGSAQAIAQQLVAERGWGDGEFNCLVSLWNKESGWNVYAHNTSSGAYGIPQSLPGNKMASVGADWASNPRTQIIWGLGYIQGRYGSPCGAWAKSQASGWY
ncbi:MAG: lytic transglycosylase domain-containing protein [Microbacteriaceae bacterium]